MSFDPATATAALMSATLLPDPSEDGQSWIHLLPAGQSGQLRTRDKRGPYNLLPAAQIIANSQQIDTDWPVDENHSIDLAANRGDPSPACGRIVEMQSRQDGIWGRVEWNARGKELMEGRAYKYISPVILHTKKDKTITAIARASLVNSPNLSGMVALNHKEPEMGLSETLRGLLKLGDDADDAAIEAAVQSALSSEIVATQAQLDTLGSHLALEAGASIDDLVAAAQSIADDTEKDDTIAALQSTVKDLGTQVETLTEDGQRSKAEAFVDAELKRGRAGLNASVRDQYVSMHMKDAAGTETLINAMPVMTGALPKGEPVTAALQSMEPGEIAAKARAYQAKQAEAGITIDIATAITHLEEGKS